MTKIKKLIKNNWIITLYYLIGFAGAVIIGWLLGRPNMLHATAFPNSTITYNENEQYCTNDKSWCLTIQYYNNYYKVTTQNNERSSLIYNSGTFSNSRITSYYLVTVTANSYSYDNSTAFYFEINSNNVGKYNEYSSTRQYYYPVSSGGGYTDEDLAESYQEGYTAGQNAGYNSGYTAGYQNGQDLILNSPNNFGLYTTQQYNNYGTQQYNAGYSAGLSSTTAYQDGYTAGETAGYTAGYTDGYSAGETAGYNSGYTAGYSAGIQYVVDHLSDYDLYTEQDYLDYGNSKYQEGYQAGITQGENNVTSNPNDYNLYTEQQYLNNGNYSDFIENQISSVWVNQPVLNNGYYNNNWIKINNSNLVINEGIIQLDTLYTNNNNITGIRIYFKTYFTNDLPLSFNNIIDPSNYQYTSVYLKCIIELPNNTMNDNISNTCQTTPGITSEINYLELEYKYLINNINYFEALANTGDVNYNYYNYLKYNCLEISNISTSGNSLNYLNGTLNTINYDITSVNLTSYNMGYDKGYRYGQQANNQAEFNRGYNEGYDDAEQLYADTSGNGNTLVGLAGTILFSPVQMLKDVFDFEILGVNLAGFILSIITLIVVAWLIKRLI